MHLERVPAGVAAALLAVVVAGACHSDTTEILQPTAAADAQVEPSRAPRPKYKTGERYASDLAAALDLPREAICRELGIYDCVGEAHRIVLGGVEPYTLGVREPLAQLPVTAPIAQDRVALSACAERIERDLEGPEALLLADVDVAVPTSEQLELAVGRLYERLLLRDADAHELRALGDFYSTVRDVGGAAGREATRDWGILACFAVATTFESIFY